MEHFVFDTDCSTGTAPGPGSTGADPSSTGAAPGSPGAGLGSTEPSL